MLDKHRVQKVLWVVPLLVLISLVKPLQADAGWDRHRDERPSYHRHHGHGHGYPHGRKVRDLPRDHISISVGGIRVYYSSGIYYKKHRHREYIAVQPPRGVIVRIVPPDCDRVIIRGATYYRSNGIYYRTVSGGYQVVDPPSTIIVEEPAAVATTMATFPAVTTTGSPDSFTVNIPNNRGGYTALVLKKTENGFIGPQGEFYRDFPRVDQLKLMYAK